MSLRRFYHKLLREVCLKRCYTNETGLSTKDKPKPESRPRTRDHMKRTEKSHRQKSVCEAEVVRIDNLATCIKGLQLYLAPHLRNDAMFKAGQWVDMLIPGVETVGGFSICNSPKELNDNGILELAVKYSDHPPAFWIHNKCNVGSKVQIRVGGNFFYQHLPFYNTLLIAGGVGINPLVSIFRHKRDRMGQLDCSSEKSMEGKTVLLYSAKKSEDLIFKESICEMCTSEEASCQFYITKETKLENSDRFSFQSPYTSLSHSKILFDDICTLTSHLQPDVTNCYICGPPSFIEVMEKYLLDCGYLKENVYFEKWW